MNRNILRSAGSVLAGFLVVLVLSVATDIVLETAGVFPPPDKPAAYLTWMLALALIYRTAYAIGGGYVTAVLAPERPMNHAIALGLIGLAVAILGTAANWNTAVASGAWYPVALIVLSFPGVWLGGRLRTG
jgi:uncharacterized membrane protein